MEITAVETIRYTYESHRTSDERGHRHPGPPTEATATLTRIGTDEDVDGYCFGGSESANEVARKHLLGEDPLAREPLWQRLKRTQRLNNGQLTDSALAAIDRALWDFAGRYLGQPVYRLLGGGREEIPAYGSTMVGDEDPDGLGTPEAYADFAEALLDRGYPAIKLHTWMPP